MSRMSHYQQRPRTQEDLRLLGIEESRISAIARHIRDQIEKKLLKAGHKPGTLVCFPIHNTEGMDEYVTGETVKEVREKAKKEYGEWRLYRCFEVVADRREPVLISSMVEDDLWR